MSGEGGEEDKVVTTETTSPASVSASTTTTTITTVINTTFSTAGTTQSPDTSQPTLPPHSSSSTTTAPTSLGEVVSLSSNTTSASSTPSTTTTITTATTLLPAPVTLVSSSFTSTTTSTCLTTTPTPIAICKGKSEEEEAEEEEGTADEPCTSLEKVHISSEQLSVISKEELAEKWLLQEKFIESLQGRIDALEREVEELRGARENEERLKGQLAELQRKEQYHIMRLSCKEHELQEMGAQVQELKNMSAGVGGLKHCLLDPAVNLLFERLKRDLDSARAKMEETQSELSAWKFTPDSNTGKQLMAKCRLLIKENEELGRMITSGRLAKLEGDLALQRNFSEELKKSQSELDEFLLEMDEDTEGMQGTIYYLQQQLRQAKERITQLNSQLALTHTPDTQSTDEGSAPVVMEAGSELNNEAERTEERTLVPQPNGDAPHDEPQTNDQSSAVDTTGVNLLTNGRKRTQSEIDDGSELADSQDAREDNVVEVEGLPPQKRTRTDGGEGEGEEGILPLMENGVMESE
ncbi:pre-mRNA-splicing regulator WTAP-like [Portunus trituberculatus]|uniref:pre-mRNA-splicing regulator WTAP-like n=1 Tax=Portunus trituberculatus TaxID=210409 RepID=UPI001E1CF52B|nr:pre-mRNA-splicing regulator WTAP-like [Portunus trituberculatus]